MTLMTWRSSARARPTWSRCRGATSSQSTASESAPNARGDRSTRNPTNPEPSSVSQPTGRASFAESAQLGQRRDARAAVAGQCVDEDGVVLVEVVGGGYLGHRHAGLAHARFLLVGQQVLQAGPRAVRLRGEGVQYERVPDDRRGGLGRMLETEVRRQEHRHDLRPARAQRHPASLAPGDELVRDLVAGRNAAAQPHDPGVLLPHVERNVAAHPDRACRDELAIAARDRLLGRPEHFAERLEPGTRRDLQAADELRLEVVDPLRRRLGRGDHQEARYAPRSLSALPRQCDLPDTGLPTFAGQGGTGPAALPRERELDAADSSPSRGKVRSTPAVGAAIQQRLHSLVKPFTKSSG